MSIGRVTGATDEQGAQRPLLIIDALTLLEHVREHMGDPDRDHRGYSESYSWNKTDIAPTVAGTDTATRILLGGDVRAVCGWAIAETTGAASAAIRLHDGRLATGEQFGRVNLIASESVRDTFVPHGVRCYTGAVTIEVLSGSVEGVLFWR